MMLLVMLVMLVMSVVTQQVEVRRLWSALPTPQTYGSQHSQQGGSLSSSPGHPLQGITQADICRGWSHSVWRTCVMAGGTETLFCVLVTGVGSSCSNIVLEALVRSHNMAARGPQRAARPCSSHCVIDNSFIFITILIQLMGAECHLPASWPLLTRRGWRLVFVLIMIPRIVWC